MKSILSMRYSISSTLFLCVLLFFVNISFAGELEDLTVKAKEGDANAQLNLGLLLVGGQGVPQDHKQAAKWLTKSARQGNVKAQHFLGGWHGVGLGVPQDYKKSVMWYAKAANQGYVIAQYKLGVIYEKGQGVPQDHKQAYVWYSLAASNGHGDAPKWRDIAASKLTPQQLAEAEQQAKVLFSQIEANKPK